MISWLQSKVATQYAKFISPDKLIGIAGNVNLHPTAIACQAVLSSLGEIVTTLDDPDSLVAISKTLLKVGPKTKKGILEFDSQYFGQINSFLNLIKPEIGLIAGLDQSNSENLGNLAQIQEENAYFLNQLPRTGAAILNWNDLNVRKLGDQTTSEVIFFGTDSQNCHLWAGNLSLHHLKVSFELNHGVERVEIQTNFIGKHQIYPLLAAAALGLKVGLRLTQIKKSLEQVSPTENQLQLKTGFNGSLLLADCEQDSPTQLDQALETLNYLPARRRILVLGEIKRLGGFSDRIHKQLAHKIYREKYDLVLLAKGQIKIAADELLELGFIADRMEADLLNPQIVASLLKILAKGDVVLVVGSKELRLDEVIAKISRK